MSERWPQIVVVAARDDLEPLEEALFEQGALSVTAEDAADEPILEPAPGTTPRWTRTCLRGMFDLDTDLAPVLRQLQGAFPAHEFVIDHSLTDRDWVRAWMVHFRPMRFGQRLWILPRHAETTELAQGVGEPAPVVVRLDPGLAFGTGTHPSTASCLRWLDGEATLRAPGARLLDYGCGSGILSVAAAKLGATRICAVDLDPQALIATRENARNNGVDGQLSVLAPDQLASSAYDLLVANILAGPLIGLAPRFAALTRPGARLKLAGILADQAEAVLAAYAPWFDVQTHAIDSEWARVEGTRKGGAA